MAAQRRTPIVKAVVFIVDEPERSLHPKLIQRFLGLFSKLPKDDTIQLIFTTYESSVMDQAHFRRDEVWCAERASDNNRFLYSRDRFRNAMKKGSARPVWRVAMVPYLLFSSFLFQEE